MRYKDIYKISVRIEFWDGGYFQSFIPIYTFGLVTYFGSLLSRPCLRLFVCIFLLPSHHESDLPLTHPSHPCLPSKTRRLLRAVGLGNRRLLHHLQQPLGPR